MKINKIRVNVKKKKVGRGRLGRRAPRGGSVQYEITPLVTAALLGVVAVAAVTAYVATAPLSLGATAVVLVTVGVVAYTTSNGIEGTKPVALSVEPL